MKAYSNRYVEKPKGPVLTDENYVDKAEEVILNLDKKYSKPRDGKYTFYLTTSQLRKLLSMTSSLYDQSNRLLDEKLSPELREQLAYLRVQFVYQAGRIEVYDSYRRTNILSVKDLIEKAEILKALQEVKDKKSLQRFCRYMEALVAYFKFYGGRD